MLTMHQWLSEARTAVARDLVDHETFLLLNRSREFMAANLDRRLSLATVADVAYLSPFHYQRLFRRAFGETPHQFLTRRRLERAQALLRQSGMTVSDVCLEVGYESLGSFSALFAREIGCAPSEFRRVFSAPGIWALRATPNCFLRMYGLRA